MNLLLLIFDIIILPITLIRLLLIYLYGSKYNIQGLEFLDVMIHADNKYFNQIEENNVLSETKTQTHIKVNTIKDDIRQVINECSLENDANESKINTEIENNNDIVKILNPEIINNNDNNDNNNNDDNYKNDSESILEETLENLENNYLKINICEIKDTNQIKELVSVTNEAFVEQNVIPEASTSENKENAETIDIVEVVETGENMETRDSYSELGAELAESVVTPDITPDITPDNDTDVTQEENRE
jgi:hypothetical protein